VRRWLLLVASVGSLAACGRVGFGAPDGGGDDGGDDAVAADATGGHDEDGDGLADAVDPCPHVAGDAADGDGDQVGDACDPHPASAIDALVDFVPFTPETTGGAPLDGLDGWTQLADSVRWTGTTTLMLTTPIASARFEVGFEILAPFGTGQHQIALGPDNGLEPHYFIELNENMTNLNAAVVEYEAGVYTTLAAAVHGGVHAGVGLIRLDANAGIAPRFAIHAGWTGEMYDAEAETPAYVGADMTRVVINGLDLELRYAVVIASE
jgi:hypothetical protein